MKARFLVLVGTIIAAAITGFCTPTLAQEPIAAIGARQALMKNVGASMKTAAGIARGQIAYDPVVAELAMRVINSSAHGFGALFPEGSNEGLKTEASAKIWSDQAGFAAKVAKFQADTSTAVIQASKGLEAYKAAFGAVASNCKGCHEVYRVKHEH